MNYYALAGICVGILIRFALNYFVIWKHRKNMIYDEENKCWHK